MPLKGSAGTSLICMGRALTRAQLNVRFRALFGALSEQNSKYLEWPSNRSDRPGKMQENQWPRNPVLTFWQSKRICSDNARSRSPRSVTAGDLAHQHASDFRSLIRLAQERLSLRQPPRCAKTVKRIRWRVLYPDEGPLKTLLVLQVTELEV
jgi:hypothetical protein